jgi:hypothetical protein
LKCTFDDPNLACHHCQRNGIECTPKRLPGDDHDKPLPSIRRRRSIPRNGRLLDSIIKRYLREDRAEVIRQLESDIQQRRSLAGVLPQSDAETTSTETPFNSIPLPEATGAAGFPQYANAPAPPNYANFVAIPQPGVQVLNFDQLNWPQDWGTDQEGSRNPKFDGTE